MKEAAGLLAGFLVIMAAVVISGLFSRTRVISLIRKVVDHRLSVDASRRTLSLGEGRRPSNIANFSATGRVRYPISSGAPLQAKPAWREKPVNPHNQIFAVDIQPDWSALPSIGNVGCTPDALFGSEVSRVGWSLSLSFRILSLSI